jgi:peroxiredoxin Q/BCP
MLSVGDKAPDFTLNDDRGGQFKLSAGKGKPVVLEFYCEDDSGGCVIENQEFSALAPAFKKAGAAVVAISPQDVETHKKFSAKYGFAHPLLADPDLQAIKAFGLWQQKKLWGNEFMGVVRVTYIVGPDGKIAAVMPARRIKGHAQKVLEAVEALTRTA